MRTDDPKSVSVLFDRTRLRLARQLAGKRKVDLARDISVTPGAITHYESGLSKPSAAVVARLSLVLGVPPSFFISDGRPLRDVEPSRAFFRSLRSTRQIEREAAEAFAAVAWEVAGILERHVRLPNVDIPLRPTPSSAAEQYIEQIAREVRREWSIPEGPIAHVVRLLETHGAIVVRRATGTTRVDAFSQWIGQRPVVVLTADKGDAARSRFDAAHELGHLVMHPDPEPGNAVLERQAHAFAAAFLMPRETILPHLPRRVDWTELQSMKATWGVSMAAILYRAHTLGSLSDSAYRRAMASMSKWGWRRAEPASLGTPEEPTLLRSALQLAEETGFDSEALADEMALPISRIAEIVHSDLRPTVSVG